MQNCPTARRLFPNVPRHDGTVKGETPAAGKVEEERGAAAGERVHALGLELQARVQGTWHAVQVEGTVRSKKYIFSFSRIFYGRMGALKTT